METFSGSSGPKDARAVIAGAPVAGQVQGMLWRWFAFLQNIYRTVYSLPPLWSCAGSADYIPREPEGPPALGTKISGLLLTLP